MFLEIDFYLLQLSLYREKGPLRRPTAQELEAFKQLGFVGTVTARPIPSTNPQRYEILAGEKFWFAAQQNQVEKVPVYVRENLSDDEARQIVMQAGKPDPISEAQALKALVDKSGNIAEAGRQIGRTRTDASHLLRLLQLCPAVQQTVMHYELSLGHARRLIGLDEQQQIELAHRIRAEKLNVRQVEALVRTYRNGEELPEMLLSSKQASQPVKDPNTVHLETELSGLLGTAVEIEYDQTSSGRLIIDFYNLEILEGVLERLGYVA